MTPSWVKVTRVFVHGSFQIMKKQGIKGLVKYLKSCSVLLQQSVGGHVLKDVGALGPRVSRTLRGLPRFIPAVQRQSIRKGDVRTVRLWMSFFALYRVLKYEGKLDISTITDPGKDYNLGPKWAQMVKLLERNKFLLPMSHEARRMELCTEPFIIQKSSPSTGKALEDGVPRSSTSFYAIS